MQKMQILSGNLLWRFKIKVAIKSLGNLNGNFLFNGKIFVSMYQCQRQFDKIDILHIATFLKLSHSKWLIFWLNIPTSVSTIVLPCWCQTNFLYLKYKRRNQKANTILYFRSKYTKKIKTRKQKRITFLCHPSSSNWWTMPKWSKLKAASSSHRMLFKSEKRAEYVLNDPPMGAEHYNNRIHRQNVICGALVGECFL